MIERYTRAEIGALLNDEARIGAWLKVEQAVLDALVAEGIAPSSAADALRAVTSVDRKAMLERERIIHHEIAAFVDVVGQAAPDAAGWLHYGLTSSDVLDTAQALQLRDALDLVVAGVVALRAAVLRRVHEHRDTLMLGRTHGMPAEPITFGFKLAGWWHQLGRELDRLAEAREQVAVGKVSGAVGTWSGVPPAVERRALAALGLARDESATQIVQRDRHSFMLSMIAGCGATIERIALEVRHLQRAEVGEVSEPFSEHQKGSSAMPHKRNPVRSERLCGMARLLRGYALVGLENVALWHERDISHSSNERVVFADALTALDFMLHDATRLVEGLVVNEGRMRDNLAREGDMIASQQVMLALVERGWTRDDAYRAVQRAAAASRAGETTMVAALRASGELPDDVSGQLDELVDPAYALRRLGAMFEGLPRAV